MHVASPPIAVTRREKKTPVPSIPGSNNNRTPAVCKGLTPEIRC